MAELPKCIAVVAYGWDIDNRHVSGYDHVIAVNRASGVVFSEYTVCADYQALSTFVPLNAKTVYVSDEYNADKIKTVHHLPEWRVVRLNPPPEYTLSILIAIWFAANHLSAREIDVFGARWSGTEDADGYSNQEQHREPERWKKERRQFEEAEKKLSARGIVLRRLLLEDINPVD